MEKTITKCHICWEQKKCESFEFLPCEHSLCGECYKKMRNHLCPFCRQPYKRSKPVDVPILNMPLPRNTNNSVMNDEELLLEMAHSFEDLEIDQGRHHSNPRNRNRQNRRRRRPSRRTSRNRNTTLVVETVFEFEFVEEDAESPKKKRKTKKPTRKNRTRNNRWNSLRNQQRFSNSF